MKQDLAHRRPWLLVSIFFGLSYLPIAAFWQIGDLYLMFWKMAAVGALVPYTLRGHHNGEFMLLAAILICCSIGDGLIEISLVAGGAAFAVAHILAIWLYLRHRRIKPAFSQKLLAFTVFIATPIIAYALAGVLAAVYSVSLAAMAAMAWSSNFPRYRVGMGAMLFVASDLLIFGREGGVLASAPITGALIWYGYYAGMLLIATGVVQTLVKRRHSSSGLFSG